MDLAFFKQRLLAMRAELQSTEQTAKDSSQIVELDQTRREQPHWVYHRSIP